MGKTTKNNALNNVSRRCSKLSLLSLQHHLVLIHEINCLRSAGDDSPFHPSVIVRSKFVCRNVTFRARRLPNGFQTEKKINVQRLCARRTCARMEKGVERSMANAVNALKANRRSQMVGGLQINAKGFHAKKICAQMEKAVERSMANAANVLKLKSPLQKKNDALNNVSSRGS